MLFLLAESLYDSGCEDRAPIGHHTGHVFNQPWHQVQVTLIVCINIFYLINI